MTANENKNRELTRRQEAALIALIEGEPLGSVAKKAKISVRSLHRWLHHDDLFIRRYRELRSGIVEQGIARIQSLLDQAVDCLQRNLTSGNRPSEVRTAVSIIRQSLEGVDVLDHDTRIRAIEARFDKGK